MKINAVVTKNIVNFKRFDLIKNSKTIITFSVMLSAIIFGALFYNFAATDFKDTLTSLFQCYSDIISEKNKTEILAVILLPSVLFTVVMLLCSSSVIGMPFIYAIDFIRVSSLTILISHICSLYALNGIEYCIIVLLPGKSFMLLSYMIITDASSDIIKSIRRHSGNSRIDIQNMFFRISAGVVLTFLHIVTDYLTVTIFSGLFDF